MSTLALRLHADTALHTPCEELTVIADETVELVGIMLGVMKVNKGVGLAANQLGISKQVAVVSLENRSRDIAMINPKIINTQGKRVRGIEGCLSIPMQSFPVKRYSLIQVEFLNLKGERCFVEATDFDARILQHEIDHLQGVTILDRANIPTK